MIPRKVDTFLPARDSRHDDLLIVCSSFEHRCMGFLKHVTSQTEKYSCKRVLRVRFDDRGDSAIRQRVRGIEPMLDSLAKKCSQSGLIEYLELEPYIIYDSYRAYKNLCRSVDTGSSVVVDVSTMPKLHCLYLLKAAQESGRIARLRMVYTRARYGRFDDLSFSSEQPTVLPLFGTHRKTEFKSSHLLLFCGLEPARSYSVWKRYGQNRCTKIFIDSGRQDPERCIARAQRMNDFGGTSSEITLDAFNPNGVLTWLKETYESSFKQGEYMYISPMTTKWELLAVWKFFSLDNRAQAGIVYTSPARLNARGHTLERTGEVLSASVW